MFRIIPMAFFGDFIRHQIIPGQDMNFYYRVVGSKGIHVNKKNKSNII